MPENIDSTGHQSEQFQSQVPDLQSSKPSTPIEDREPIVPRDDEGKLAYAPPPPLAYEREEGLNNEDAVRDRQREEHKYKSKHAINAGAASDRRDWAGLLPGDDIPDGTSRRVRNVKSEVIRAYQEARAEGRLDDIPENLATPGKFVERERQVSLSEEYLASQKYDFKIFDKAIENNAKAVLREYISSLFVRVSDKAPKSIGSYGRNKQNCLTLFLIFDEDGLKVSYIGSPQPSERWVARRMSGRDVPEELLDKMIEIEKDGNLLYSQLDRTKLIVQICRDYLVPSFEVELEDAKKELTEVGKILGLTTE